MSYSGHHFTAEETEAQKSLKAFQEKKLSKVTAMEWLSENLQPEFLGGSSFQHLCFLLFFPISPPHGYVYARISLSVMPDSVTPWTSPPGSSVHGILQDSLEWVAIPFSRVSSRPRDETSVSCIAGGFFTIWATREAHPLLILPCFLSQITSLQEPVWAVTHFLLCHLSSFGNGHLLGLWAGMKAGDVWPVMCVILNLVNGEACVNDREEVLTMAYAHRHHHL